MGTRTKLSTFSERIEWLLVNKHLLLAEADLHAIVLAMKRDKLLAPSTYWKDVHLEEAIRQAKIRLAMNRAVGG
jgi:hypothetical protein